VGAAGLLEVALVFRQNAFGQNMKCELCSGETKILKGQDWHYIESGFDNVYLSNVEVRTCNTCKAKSPRIPRIKHLHAAIGRAIEANGETSSLLINVDNPNVYSYRSNEEKAS
jgi:Lhr-like helicase